MSIQKLIRRILPREESFYDLLENLARLANSSAVELTRLGATPCEPKAVAQAVQEIEHQADSVFHEVETALAKTFVTPLDREDIHQLAFEIDDVVDMVNLSARTFVMFHLSQPSEPMVALCDTLLRCTEALGAALPLLRRHDYDGIIAAGRVIRGIEKEADSIFRNAVSSLFQDAAIDAKQLLREKELLEHIEDAVDRCDRLANTLCNLAVKHG